MAKSNQVPEPNEVPESGANATPGADAQASAPTGGSPSEAGDTLTVEDILNAAGMGDAAEAEASQAGTDSAPDYLADLQRIQAEFANYRRRTDEQRLVEIQRARGEAGKGLLPVLDDLDRAAAHGDLPEGSAFAAIAEKIRVAVERLGIESFGAVGDAFDPQQHEAIFQQPTPGATSMTILDVVETGYRLGDVELRPAKVVVAVPAE